MPFSLYPQSGRQNHQQNETPHDSINIKWPSNTRPLSIPSKSTVTIQTSTQQPTEEELEAMSFRNLAKSRPQKWILAVSWTIQYLAIVFGFVSSIIGTVNLKENTQTGQYAYNTSIGAIVLVFSAMAIYLLLTLIETIQYARSTLGPLYYTVSNFFKATGCIFILIAGLVMKDFGTIDIIVWTVASIFFVCPMAYGAVLIHKQRAMRRAIYNRAAMKGNTEYLRDLGSGAPYDGANPLRNSSANPATPYDLPSRADWVDVEAGPEPQVPRRASYNHKKDTRFASYRESLLPGNDPQESYRRSDSA